MTSSVAVGRLRETLLISVLFAVAGCSASLGPLGGGDGGAADGADLAGQPAADGARDLGAGDLPPNDATAPNDATTGDAAAPNDATTGDVAATGPAPPFPLTVPAPSDCTLFVAPAASGGSDGNDGRTIGKPLQTLTAALHNRDARGKGERVCLRGGTYVGQSYVEAARGDADHWIVVQPYKSEKPVIKIDQSYGCGIILSVETAYVEIRGLEIVGNTSDTLGSLYAGGGCTGGITVGNHDEAWANHRDGAHHVRLLHNVIHDFPGGGISGYKTNHLIAAFNRVYNNAYWATNQTSGISILGATNAIGGGDDAAGYSIYVYGNTVYHNENRATEHYPGGTPQDKITDGNCVILDLFNASGYTGRTLIAHNICFDNGGRGIHLYKSSHADIESNTLYHNARTPCDSAGKYMAGAGELSAYEATDARFYRNIAWVNAACPYPVPTNSVGNTDVSFEDNLYVGRSGGEGEGTDGNVTVLQNPGLASPSTDPGLTDFSIVPGSQADQMHAGANP